ncbi:hypothetical protein EYF80_010786 [Liparis tanakae]|uniref:Uncharacterized protein n=1 Tax=Liparis tanakae TaxID=230148 RepID=A0A4Z2IMV6_9TELE|nr:hypothetical protein EYF80_010786 [Liparis tanakae]
MWLPSPTGELRSSGSQTEDSAERFNVYNAHTTVTSAGLLLVSLLDLQTMHKNNVEVERENHIIVFQNTELLLHSVLGV